mmetsp:Transcript_104410/g.179921  ORF Transcript_104410/g.179921 Transcript_104410/m.179921 type:complete len:85 (+) Transcript_104410:127-381(+)
MGVCPQKEGPPSPFWVQLALGCSESEPGVSRWGHGVAHVTLTKPNWPQSTMLNPGGKLALTPMRVGPSLHTHPRGSRAGQPVED